jgi:hypothetical protein
VRLDGWFKLVPEMPSWRNLLTLHIDRLRHADRILRVEGYVWISGWPPGVRIDV